jgi:hypothetical protein
LFSPLAGPRRHVYARLLLHLYGRVFAARILETPTEEMCFDRGPAVQTAVVEALLFRRAERHASELLGVASDEVWEQLARKWHPEEVQDATLAARLRAVRQRQFETETDPLARLSLLTESGEDDAATKAKVAEILMAADFPWQDQYAASAINQTSRRFPGEVAAGLLHRLSVFFPALSQTDRDYVNDLRNRLSATRPASFILY